MAISHPYLCSLCSTSDVTHILGVRCRIPMDIGKTPVVVKSCETQTTTWYGDEEVMMNKVTSVPQTTVPRNDLFDIYEIERTIMWINEGKFKMVTMQFPDFLLGDSASVVAHIRLKMSDSCELFVLADSSYGPCCIDEVAAEHVHADAIIHYGPACLTPVKRLPVLYIFGRLCLDIDAFKEAILDTFPNTPLLIFYDVQYHYIVPKLKIELSSSLPHLVWTQLIDGGLALEGTQRFGRIYNLPQGHCQDNEYTILYIGNPCSFLNNLIMTFNRNTVWSHSPDYGLRREGLNVNRALMKRFHLIECAKDANIFGVVIATLSVNNYLSILEHLKSIIKAAGKKYYILAVGKLNVAKLANFAELDMFILVACPENSLIDSSDYYKPCITPFEAEIALCPGKEWQGEYHTDFDRILVQENKALPLNSEGDHNVQDFAPPDDSVRVSLISNRIMPDHKALQATNDKSHTSIMTKTTESHGHELNGRTKMNVCLASGTGANASQVFLRRTFQGLQQRLGEDKAHGARIGQSGIAWEYEHEIN